MFAPVTGYFSVFSQTGLEEAANHFLDGTDDRLATRNLVDKILGNPVPGGTVESTVDVKAQRVAYEALKSSGVRRAAAVVLDADTGAVLVLASTPSYDPNDVSVLDGRRPRRSSSSSTARSSSRCSTNPRGALPARLHVQDRRRRVGTGGRCEREHQGQGRTQLPAAGRRAAHRQRRGDIGGSCDLSQIPLIEAYAQSCNTTFAYMGAEEPGNDAVHKVAGEFGFGDRIEYADGLLSAASSFPTTDQPVLSALGSIGQGSTVATPLQMAMVVDGVLNGGEVMQPHLIDKLRAPSGSTVDTISPKRMSRALTSDQAKQMRDMMEAVVDHGTGKSLKGTSILGGKTGTADVEGAAYNDRWFIGFGPRKDPKYAVAVMTEAPGYGIESGPIAAKIIDALGD